MLLKSVLFIGNVIEANVSDSSPIAEAVKDGGEADSGTPKIPCNGD